MGKISSRETLNRIGNQLWSMVFVAPLVVMFWRGVWDILDIAVYPDFEAKDHPHNNSRKEKSGMICVLLGITVRIVLDLAKFHLGEFLHSKPGALRVTGGYLYTLLYAAAGVSFWRGVWLVMRFDIGEKQVQLSVMLVGGVTVLVFSGVASTLITTPLAICQDKHEDIFTLATFFQRTPENKRWFVTDVLFTNMIIRVLIVMCWWSLWSLEGNVLIPNLIGVKDEKVAYYSFVLGYILAVLVAVFDRLLVNHPFSKQYINKPLRIVIIILAFIASVNVWRGVWSIYDNFLFPGVNPALNYIASTLFAYIVLALLKLSNTICNDMVVWDSEEGPIVLVDYWTYGVSTANNDEMIPIVE
eukprot:TRINITY_DN3098_c0_g1_i10.p1 TRINITY_DN3098_c0_g1~~TRINITY_DN3098_c0_g1_i10.p1  ORF type:complete len:357 (+),score=67.20 TRINITY_DN3098_c0_g1_i10:318-1388(+)